MKQIPLTKGQCAIVDDEHFDALVAMGAWYLDTGGYAAHSAKRVNGRTRKVYMHREVMRLTGREVTCQVDHRNLNRLDNRSENLRAATDAQNKGNLGTPSHNTSGFKGVSWNKRRQKWEAYISLNDKKKTLGRFDSKEAAARAYDRAAIEHRGEFSRLNFPPEATAA